MEGEEKGEENMTRSTLAPARGRENAKRRAHGRDAAPSQRRRRSHDRRRCQRRQV